MDVVTGVRVVRGPDWKWTWRKPEDGGEGSVGTVSDIQQPTDGNTIATVVVQWDNGNRCSYRYGAEGSYDLRVFDNAPTGVVHPNFMCDSCRQRRITGMRWNCNKCYDYDLCTNCYNAGRHDVEHDFSRVDYVDGPRTQVAPRKSARKVVAKGLFQDATVVRGHDWEWDNQDGGYDKTGTLQKLQGWEDDDDQARNAAWVEWKETNKGNVYRIGHNGKMDLKCKVAATGGYYYPGHLPVLGAPYQSSPLRSHHQFKPGDHVKVNVGLMKFKEMQAGHGAWADEMTEATKKVGVVQSVLASGDLRVQFSGRTWTINPNVLIQIPTFSAGDVVRVLADRAKVRRLQEGYGGWVDDMEPSLGELGRVSEVHPTGAVSVDVKGDNWTFSPFCINLEPDESLSDTSSEDSDLDMGLLSLLGGPGMILVAASAGDVERVRELLNKKPRKVNAKVMGKAAIHCAATAGNIQLVRLLLEFKADLDIGDEDGDTPLHLCAYSDEGETAQVLIEAGANVNSKNDKGTTALMIAAAKGHHDVLKRLANSPNILLQEQDVDADTALHFAVLATQDESVAVLLGAGADPTILNSKGFAPIHEAAKKGFCAAVRQLVYQFPRQVNLKKDDGYTPLHLAVLNNHLDVVVFLAQQDNCVIDAKTDKQRTALHIAAYSAHSRILEKLVQYGAALNVQDMYGDTPLHDVLARDVVVPISDETPRLKKVQDNLRIPSTSGKVTVACFLVQEGADISIRNKEGQTPLQRCSPEIAAVIETNCAKTGRSDYSRQSDYTDNAGEQEQISTGASKAMAVVKISYSDLEFGETVGGGAFGTVYKGRWKSRGLEVAIKRATNVVKKEEVEILTRLEHPNIICIYGEVVDKGNEYFIVTAYAEEGSLYDLIHTKKTRVGHQQNLQWAREIAQGMNYLHQKKIIHRDLKSSNVLLGTNWTVKICDFGAAKEFDRTTVDSATGTVRWMAPEVLKGEPISLSCDVFSYGMVLYEIFTCKLPFEEIKATFAVAAKAMGGETPDIPNECEPHLANLMQMCWSINPKARPSFQDILFNDMLEKGGQPIKNPQKSDSSLDMHGQSLQPMYQTTANTLTLADLPVLQSKLQTVSGLWYPLGVKLQLQPNVLGGIPRVAGNDHATCLSVMLMQWLQCKEHPPTLDALINSLNSPEIGDRHLAESLKNEGLHVQP